MVRRGDPLPNLELAVNPDAARRLQRVRPIKHRVGASRVTGVTLTFLPKHPRVAPASSELVHVTLGDQTGDAPFENAKEPSNINALEL